LACLHTFHFTTQLLPQCQLFCLSACHFSCIAQFADLPPKAREQQQLASMLKGALSSSGEAEGESQALRYEVASQPSFFHYASGSALN
jgi:hypothetical protein